MPKVYVKRGGWERGRIQVKYTYELFDPQTRNSPWEAGIYRVEKDARKRVWVIILEAAATGKEHGNMSVAYHVLASLGGKNSP